VEALFLADADLNHQIVTGLERLDPEIDFQSAVEAGLKGLRDSEVLEVASRTGRILVSHDRKTMPKAFYAFIEMYPSPGLILIKQGCPVGHAIDELRICARLLQPSEFAKTIRYIPL
jgi:hypothetical protein